MNLSQKCPAVTPKINKTVTNVLNIPASSQYERVGVFGDSLLLGAGATLYFSAEETFQLQLQFEFRAKLKPFG